jgi:hypothetical protein
MAEYINAVGEAQAKLAERRIDKRLIGEIGQGFEALRVCQSVPKEVGPCALNQFEGWTKGLRDGFDPGYRKYLN